ncbi:phage tail protein [Enterobacter hormaechei]|nr:phage tail protein [Enterobacter hormaechei]MCM7910105.1 phage tail protein [Enterobacter hormaechei]
MSAGTLTLTNNSAAVTGSGTAFTTELVVGDFIVVTVGGIPYTLAIKTVNSNTSLTLVSNYTGPTQGGAAWYAVPRVAMNLVTAALVAQSAEALRGLNYDKQNWQRLFSVSGNITVTLPDGSSFTGPSWQYMVNTVATKTNGAVPVNQGGTGATNAADARSNLGLGNSATRNVDDQFSPGWAYLGGAAVMAQCHRDYRSLASYDAIAQYPLGMSFGIQSGGNAWGGGSGVDTYTGMLTLRGWHDFSGGGYVSWQLASTSQGLKYRQGNGTIQGNANVGFSTTHTLYSTQNTTKASDGTLKAASPVIKVFSDGAYQTNDESEGCTVTRMKTGEYLIEGCMGMNSDAEWGGIDGGFDIPKDRNGQALIWLDYEVNADGSVLVKTFHREYPTAPAFARNSREGYADGDPADIPADQFVSVRVEMPQNSIWNQRAAMAEVPDSPAD